MENWFGYVCMTMVCFGTYGVFLHQGTVAMGDPTNGRIKAFLFVGTAYFLVAVLAPLVLLTLRGASWDIPAAGAGWSLLAGTAGAIGAFGILLAFGAKGTPAVVMSLVFGGAPIVNAIVSVTKAGLWGEIRWPFVFGILLAAVGGGLVSLYKPTPQHAPAAPTVAPAPEGP